MYRVYGDIQSGNCYKIKLLMNHLDIEHDWVHVDILTGATRTPEFMAKNPNGKIPLLEFDDGRHLSESNAILNFLATGTTYLPDNAWLRAKVLQWQFFEQYSHEPYIATARFIAKYLGLPDSRRAEYDAKQAGGIKALEVMEHRLAGHAFLVGHGATIADITLYAYTHVAHEGGFSLEAYPGIRAWLDRVSSHHKHITMEEAGR